MIYKDRHEEAKAILTKYHGNNDPNSAVVEIEYSEMCQTLEYEKTVQKTNFKALFKTKSNRWRLGVVAATSSKCHCLLP